MEEEEEELKEKEVEDKAMGRLLGYATINLIQNLKNLSKMHGHL